MTTTPSKKLKFVDPHTGENLHQLIMDNFPKKLSVTTPKPNGWEEKLEKVKLLDTKHFNDVWNSWKFIPSQELKDFIRILLEEREEETVKRCLECIGKDENTYRQYFNKGDGSVRNELRQELRQAISAITNKK